ncbi:hypothetical protein A2U01_0014458, partial [Trifolium medium]|nr:hypothetical protein [Trifolium medium]
QYDNIIVLEPITDTVVVQAVTQTQVDGVLSDGDDANTIVVEPVPVHVTDPVAKIDGTAKNKETSYNAVYIEKGNAATQADLIYDAGGLDARARQPLLCTKNPDGVDDNVTHSFNDVGVHENTRVENQTHAAGANSDSEEELNILVEPMHEYVPETQLANQSPASKSNAPGTSMDSIFRDTQGRALPLVVQNDMQLIRQAWADRAEQEQEQEFTTVISKQRKKKNNRIAQSAGSPYQTRSKGAPPL